VSNGYRLKICEGLILIKGIIEYDKGTIDYIY